MKYIKRFTVGIIILLFQAIPLHAQQEAWRDTLPEAVSTATRRVGISLGRLQTGLEGIRSVVSPMGEGDPIRGVQSLPGVTTGADGTTTIYVRGGGVGNNLFSLDGVPVYGYSHILGLTTIVPTQMIGTATLLKGGFDGSDGNFTASHLRIETKAPSTDGFHAGASVNNFLVSADAEGPIGKRLSFLMSARVSPLSWEYKAVRGILPSLLGGMDNFSAKVGDVYGKLQWRTGERSAVTASVMASEDRYGFDTPDASHEVMGWNNLVGMVRFRRNGINTDFSATFSANRYGTLQEQDKIYRESENHLSLQSTLTEYILSVDLRHLILHRFIMSEGGKLRRANFQPGQLNELKKRTDVLLATGWLQMEYSIPDRLYLKAVGRVNHYRNYNYQDMFGDAYWQQLRMAHLGTVSTLPEMSLSAKWHFTPKVEAHVQCIISYVISV